MKRQLAILALLAVGCAGEKPKSPSRFFTPNTYGESSVPATVDAAAFPADAVDAQPDTPEPENFWGVEDRPVRQPDGTLIPPSEIDYRSETRVIIQLLLPYQIKNRQEQSLAWLSDKTRRKFVRVEFPERPDLGRLFDVSWVQGAEKYYHGPWGASSRVTWDRDFVGVQLDFDPPDESLRHFLSRPFLIEFTVFEPDTRCSFRRRATVDFSVERNFRIPAELDTITDWSDSCAEQ